MLISDHVSQSAGLNPLVGPNDDALGPHVSRIMSEAYPARYREIARQCARELGIELTQGVYAAMLGPSYETPAEIRFLRTIGADVVGMSTVPEVIVADHMGMRVLAISPRHNIGCRSLCRKRSITKKILETGAHCVPRHA